MINEVCNSKIALKTKDKNKKKKDMIKTEAHMQILNSAL
jgi:hypothetical protein